MRDFSAPRCEGDFCGNRWHWIALRRQMVIQQGDVTVQKKLLGLSAVLAMMTLAACETVQGAGRDISTAGAVVQQESAEVQSGM